MTNRPVIAPLTFGRVRFSLVMILLVAACNNVKQDDHGASSKEKLTTVESIHSSSVEPILTKPSVLQPGDWFEDVTEKCGVRFTHRNGREAGLFYMIESFGGGAAAVDFDRDGDCDLFIAGGGTLSKNAPDSIRGLPSALFRNNGEWSFTDVSNVSGLARPADYSQGCAVTDFNVDGFPDLFLCCYGRSRLYRNCGDGTFVEVIDSALPQHDWATAASFADLDRDGLPDLVVARYTDWCVANDVKCNERGIRDLCGPTSYAGTTCLALRNRGDGSFDDWSAKLGLHGAVRGLAVVNADLNLDGWVDIYVASDVTANQLYLGGPSLPFVECATTAGVAVNEWGQPESSMGVDVGDYNGDGQPDIWITNFEKEDNTLYRNLGNGQFLHSTVSAGLAGVSRMRVGFGTAMTDFDGDGWQDLFVLNGNPIYAAAETPFKQYSQVFRNLGGRFEDATEKGGTFFRELHSGRGDTVVDLDDDGAPDLVVVLMNEPVKVLRNTHTPANFIRVQIVGRAGEPDATGARVWCDFDGRQITQFAVRGTGFFSQFDSRMIFPAAPSTETAEVTVAWPGRGSEVFRGLAVRKTHVLIEGQGEKVNE